MFYVDMRQNVDVGLHYNFIHILTHLHNFEVN
jgi:hypothetical protein